MRWCRAASQLITWQPVQYVLQAQAYTTANAGHARSETNLHVYYDLSFIRPGKHALALNQIHQKLHPGTSRLSPAELSATKTDCSSELALALSD